MSSAIVPKRISAEDTAKGNAATNSGLDENKNTGLTLSQNLEITEKKRKHNNKAKSAEELTDLARDLSDQNEYAKAESLYKRVLAITEQEYGLNHEKTADALTHLGDNLFNQTKYRKAQPLFERALLIREKALGRDHADTASSLNDLGLTHQKQASYSKAEQVFKRALIIREKSLGPDHPDTAISLKNIASLYSTQGLHKKANSFLQRALTVVEEHSDRNHLDIVHVLNDIGINYLYQGLYSKAESVFMRALTISQKTLGAEHHATGLSSHHLASTYSEQGLYSKAEPLYKRALLIRENTVGEEHPDTATSINNLANLYMYQGLLSKAAPLYERALAVNTKALGSEHPTTSISLNNLAYLYNQQGLGSKAKPLYQRALLIAEKTLGADHPGTAIKLINLGNIYADEGSYSKAEPLFKRALEIEENTLGADHPETASSLDQLASLYSSQGLYRKAESLYQRSLLIREKALGEDHPDIAHSLNNLALAYEIQGFNNRALPLYLRALKISKSTVGKKHQQTTMIMKNIGFHYFGQGLYAKGERLIRHVMINNTSYIQQEVTYLSRNSRESFLKSIGSIEPIYSIANKGKTGAKLALFARLNMHGLLEELEKRQAQLASLPGKHQQLVIELRELTRESSSLSLEPERRQILKLQKDKLEMKLYRLLPKLQPRLVTINEIVEFLPDDGVLIEFQHYHPFDFTELQGVAWEKEARYLAMVLKSNGDIAVVDLGAADAIEMAISQLVNGIEQQSTNVPNLTLKVRELVIDPLLVSTSGAKTWFLSPDGELNRLPFAALPSVSGEGYLSDEVQMRLVTTGRELLDLQKPAKESKNNVLVVADPAYLLKSVPNKEAGWSNSNDALDILRERSTDLPDQLKWNRLEATAKEGKAIQKLIGGKLWMREEATAEAVKRLKAPKVLHLATHAFYLPDRENPVATKGVKDLSNQRASRSAVRTKSLQGESPLLRSGIALAGANHPSANKDDDGYLTALEVAQLDWNGTELVVISACESGRGDIRAGEGVYGLKRSISVAGARSSLLSLWKVDDAATAAFMESFYKRLKSGEGRGDALASTQAEFRDHPIPLWREPYVWAAFQLSGDWGPMKFR